MSSKVFDVKYQLVFYGQYHANKYNIAIHLCFVPLILWTTMIIEASLPTPGFFPSWKYDILPPYFTFAWTWATPMTAVYGLYYLLLEPVAGLLYMPILGAMFLSSAPLASTAWGVKMAAWLFGLSWVAQFAGHGLAEKRSPALLDNLLGALVLAPLFVHLEILFAFGYRPQFHREITNGIATELVKYRRQKALEKKAKNI